MESINAQKIIELHLNDQSIKNNDTSFDFKEESYCGKKTKWVGTDFDQLWIEKLKGKTKVYGDMKFKLCEECSDVAIERIMSTV